MIGAWFAVAAITAALAAMIPIVNVMFRRDS